MFSVIKKRHTAQMMGAFPLQISVTSEAGSFSSSTALCLFLHTAQLIFGIFFFQPSNIYAFSI